MFLVIQLGIRANHATKEWMAVVWDYKKERTGNKIREFTTNKEASIFWKEVKGETVKKRGRAAVSDSKTISIKECALGIVY